MLPSGLGLSTAQLGIFMIWDIARITLDSEV